MPPFRYARRCPRGVFGEISVRKKGGCKWDIVYGTGSCGNCCFFDASLLVDSVSTVNLETVLSSNLTDLNFGMKQYLGFFLLRF